MGSAQIGKFVLGMVFTISGTVAVAQQQRNTWREYLGGPDSSHYSALVQINRSNVARIVVPWTYDTQDDLRTGFPRPSVQP